MDTLTTLCDRVRRADTPPLERQRLLGIIGLLLEKHSSGAAQAGFYSRALNEYDAVEVGSAERDEAVRSLRMLLSDEEREEVQVGAAWALGCSGREGLNEAIPGLIDFLRFHGDGPSEVVRQVLLSVDKLTPLEKGIIADPSKAALPPDTLQVLDKVQPSPRYAAALDKLKAQLMRR